MSRTLRDTDIPAPEILASADRGAAIGREAAAQMNALINKARQDCRGDDAALAAMSTVLLHKIVVNGNAAVLTGDSAASALRHDRGRAVVALGLSSWALTTILPGVGETRARQIVEAGHRANRR